MENKNKKASRPGQVTLVLRLAAGLYLVYQAWELTVNIGEYSGSRQLLQVLCVIVFAAAGLVFAAWSLKKLVCGEFMRSGEEQE